MRDAPAVTATAKARDNLLLLSRFLFFLNPVDGRYEDLGKGSSR